MRSFALLFLALLGASAVAADTPAPSAAPVDIGKALMGAAKTMGGMAADGMLSPEMISALNNVMATNTSYAQVNGVFMEENGALWDQCTMTGSCRDGAVCYEKNAFYRQCRDENTCPQNGNWTCRVYTEPPPAAPYQSCKLSRCCAVPGYSCYEFPDASAMCLPNVQFDVKSIYNATSGAAGVASSLDVDPQAQADYRAASLAMASAEPWAMKSAEQVDPVPDVIRDGGVAVGGLCQAMVQRLAMADVAEHGTPLKEAMAQAQGLYQASNQGTLAASSASASTGGTTVSSTKAVDPTAESVMRLAGLARKQVADPQDPEPHKEKKTVKPKGDGKAVIKAPVALRAPLYIGAPLIAVAPVQVLAPTYVLAPLIVVAPLTILAPTFVLAPVTVVAPFQILAPTFVLAPLTVIAPTQILAPLEILAPVEVLFPLTILAPVTVLAPVVVAFPVVVMSTWVIIPYDLKALLPDYYQDLVNLRFDNLGPAQLAVLAAQRTIQLGVDYTTQRIATDVATVKATVQDLVANHDIKWAFIFSNGRVIEFISVKDLLHGDWEQFGALRDALEAEIGDGSIVFPNWDDLNPAPFLPPAELYLPKKFVGAAPEVNQKVFNAFQAPLNAGKAVQQKLSLNNFRDKLSHSNPQAAAKIDAAQAGFNAKTDAMLAAMPAVLPTNKPAPPVVSGHSAKETLLSAQARLKPAAHAEEIPEH